MRRAKPPATRAPAAAGGATSTGSSHTGRSADKIAEEEFQTLAARYRHSSELSRAALDQVDRIKKLIELEERLIAVVPPSKKQSSSSRGGSPEALAAATPGRLGPPEQPAERTQRAAIVAPDDDTQRLLDTLADMRTAEAANDWDGSSEDDDFVQEAISNEKKRLKLQLPWHKARNNNFGAEAADDGRGGSSPQAGGYRPMSADTAARGGLTLKSLSVQPRLWEHEELSGRAVAESYQAREIPRPPDFSSSILFDVNERMAADASMVVDATDAFIRVITNARGRPPKPDVLDGILAGITHHAAVVEAWAIPGRLYAIEYDSGAQRISSAAANEVALMRKMVLEAKEEADLVDRQVSRLRANADGVTKKINGLQQTYIVRLLSLLEAVTLIQPQAPLETLPVQRSTTDTRPPTPIDSPGHAPEGEFLARRPRALTPSLLAPRDGSRSTSPATPQPAETGIVPVRKRHFPTALLTAFVTTFEDRLAQKASTRRRGDTTTGSPQSSRSPTATAIEPSDAAEMRMTSERLLDMALRSLPKEVEASRVARLRQLLTTTQSSFIQIRAGASTGHHRADTPSASLTRQTHQLLLQEQEAFAKRASHHVKHIEALIVGLKSAGMSAPSPAHHPTTAGAADPTMSPPIGGVFH